jgi:hypothetical protein
MDTASPAALLAPLIPLAAAAGLNLYATGLIAGLLGHYHWIALPPGLHWLENPWVIGVFAAMFALEFFADKIRYVDVIWNFLHTVIRPVGALVLAIGLTKELPEWSLPLLLLAGATAFTTHAAKSSLSLGLKLAPPVGLNTLRSIAEDSAAIGLTWLAFTHPWIALSLFLIIMAVFAWLTPRLLALARVWLVSPLQALKVFFKGPLLSPVRRFDGWINALFGKSLPMPAELDFIHPAFISRGKGLGFWRRGHLAVAGETLYIVRPRWFAKPVTAIPLQDIHHLRLQSGWFWGELEVNLPRGRALLLIPVPAVSALADTLAGRAGEAGAWEINRPLPQQDPPPVPVESLN